MVSVLLLMNTEYLITPFTGDVKCYLNTDYLVTKYSRQCQWHYTLQDLDLNIQEFLMHLVRFCGTTINI